MIKGEKPKPKFIHKNTRSEENKFNVVFMEFMKMVKNQGVRMIKNGEIKIDFDPNESLDLSGERLLALRKWLVKSVKSGMIERKDQEEKIALLAMLVWFNRLDVEQKAQIIATWG